jgi:hypothetical protein
LSPTRPAAAQSAAQDLIVDVKFVRNENLELAPVADTRKRLEGKNHQKVGDGGISLSKTETPNLSFIPEDIKRSCNIGIVIQELSRPTR